MLHRKRALDVFKEHLHHCYDRAIRHINCTALSYSFRLSYLTLKAPTNTVLATNELSLVRVLPGLIFLSFIIVDVLR